MTQSEITVGSPELVDPFMVRYEIDASRSVRRYFSSQRMFVKYDTNVTDVPPAILLVPFLATVAPIAWLLDARARVPVIDESLLDALPRVRQSMQRLYPTLYWGGDVQADAIVDCPENAGRRTALLFSGGVDSLASYVGHRRENPLLVSVWGADVGLGRPERWQSVAADQGAFARERGLDVTFVATNFRTFFNHYRLRDRFFPRFANWYSAIQQGLGLVALCAPLSWTHGVERVLIPSSHTADWKEPWGSHPTIENNVRWARTEVVHDGYHLTRQAKLGVLARYIREEDPRLRLRVCWGAATNCARCEKCCLTIVGLLLEGLDPREHGFRCDAEIFSHIRRQHDAGRLPSRASVAWTWREVQRRIPGRVRIDIEGFDEFLVWLEAVAMEAGRVRGHRSRRARLRQYLRERPEPVGRWIRRALGHPFP